MAVVTPHPRQYTVNRRVLGTVANPFEALARLRVKGMGERIPMRIHTYIFENKNKFVKKKNSLGGAAALEGVV